MTKVSICYSQDKSDVGQGLYGNGVIVILNAHFLYFMVNKSVSKNLINTHI